MLFSVTTVFTAPEKVYAQQDISGTIQSTATSLFVNPKRSLQTGLSAATTEEDRATYQALLSTLSRAEESFILNFSESAKNLPTEAAYSVAINAALGIIINEQSSNTVLRRPIATNFINNLQSLFTAEISNRQYLRAITTGDAVSTNTQNLANAVLNAGGVTTAKDVETLGKCAFTFTGTFSFLDCVNELITWFIKTILLNIAGFFLWVSANMLNTAIQMSILDFSKWAPDALYPIWITIRQIISLCVVFAGLWLGFMYIIDRGDKFEKYIPWVILFALFVNFSYPIARTLVDISNVISLNIYTSAVGGDSLGASSSTLSTSSNAGSLIMSRLGLQDLVVSATSPTNTAGNMLGQINSMPGALLAVMFVFYAAFVFFMATAIIVIRSAVLVFLIIASPLLLVDSVIPKLGDAAAKLRKAFFEQLVVAPVFMLMFALTLKFLEVFRTGSGPLSAGNGENIKVFFNILMMLIMLHIMLKVTRSVSGSAGQFATNALGKVGGFGLGVATGGAGFLARGTMGRMAAVARDSKWVTNNQDKMLGRGVYGLTNSLAKSSYDARNITSISSTMGKAGIPLGKGVASSYERDLANRAADRQARYEKIETSYKKDKFDSSGKLIHKAGDIDKYGVEAANRFRRNQGGLSNTLLGGVSSFAFNKKEIGEKLEETESKVFATKSAKQKSEYLHYLQSQASPMEQELAVLARTDPTLGSIKARGLQQKIKPLSDEIKTLTEKYGKDIRDYEDGLIQTITKYSQSDAKNRIAMRLGAEKDNRLKQFMISVDKYLSVDGTTEDDLNKKTDALLEIGDSDVAKAVIKNSSLGKLEEEQKKELEAAEIALSLMNKVGETEEETKLLKKEYDSARVALEKKKRDQREFIESIRKSLEEGYTNKAGGKTTGTKGADSSLSSIDVNEPDINLNDPTRSLEELQLNPNAANTPAYLRKEAAASMEISNSQKSVDQVAIDISGENTDWRQTVGGRPGSSIVTTPKSTQKFPTPTDTVPLKSQTNQPVNINVVSLADMIKQRRENKNNPVSA